MQFKNQSVDGEIELLSLNSVQDVGTLEKGTPHEGTTCSFKILEISEFSSGQSPTNPYLLAESKYLSSGIESGNSNNNGITATIGISSVSEDDRLIDICLTRLHVGECGQFAIVCARSKSSFIIKLELVHIDGSLDLFEPDKSTILKIAANLKQEGSNLFKDGFVIDSFFKFSQAFKFLTFLPDPSTQQDLINILQNNMANCHVKVGNWEEAIDLCNSVLEHDKNNVKGLYRRGLSFIEIQEFERADEDLQKAEILDPGNQAIKNKLAILKRKKKALDAKYAQAMKKFLA